MIHTQTESTRTPRAARAAAAVPLTVVAGYFGAGKTTVLTHVLRTGASRRIAVLVSDADRARIDASLARRHAASALRPQDGCIFCGSGSAFADALADLRHRTPPPEHVLIEAGAAADPEQIGQYGFLPGYALDGIVGVTDAEALRAHASHPEVGPHVTAQLHAADLIVLNKADLVSPGEKEGACDWLRHAIPDARIVEASCGRVPPGLLLGWHSSGGDRLRHRPEDPGWAAARHAYAPDYTACSWSGDEPIDEAAFRWWAGSLPASVLRATGILHFRGRVGYRYVFHLIGARWSVRCEGDWGWERPRTAISLLAQADRLDSGWLEMTLRRSGVTRRRISG